MKVEFWSDVVCPWCGLMDQRLQLALAQFEHGAEVEVVHRSFQLHPELAREGVEQLQLFEMYGMPAAAGIRVIRQIEKLAEVEGLSPYYALDRTLGPTDLAHELLAYASAQGRGGEIWSAMFRAHFGERRKFWTVAEVLGFAAEVGLDGAAVAEALDSRRYRERVNADQQEAKQLGAKGVPFFRLDGRYVMAGAAGTDDLVSALRRAWNEAHPSVPALIQMSGPSEQMCGPDSCATPN